MKNTDPLRQLNILLIEDSVSDAALLQENIRSAGVKELSIGVAESLQQARDYLKNNPADAVLLDLSLPDSSGLETVRRARVIARNLPIVVLTGIDDESTGVDAVRLGAQDYLVKGRMDGRMIALAVRYAVERHSMEEELHRAHNELELRVLERTKELAAAIETISDEIEKRRLAQEKLRDLTTELLLAEERERHQIATELHDSVGPLLAFSKIELGSLQKTVSPEIAESLKTIGRRIGDVIKQTRTLTFELSPPALYTLGLEAAIKDLAEKFGGEQSLDVVVEDDGKQRVICDSVKVLLYRSVREIFVNIAKHARAKKVKAAISSADNHIRISVSDDGTGFDVAASENKAVAAGGFGLFSIRERLSHMGGTFNIHSDGKGTIITLTAPLRLSGD